MGWKNRFEVHHLLQLALSLSLSLSLSLYFSLSFFFEENQGLTEFQTMVNLPGLVAECISQLRLLGVQTPSAAAPAGGRILRTDQASCRRRSAQQAWAPTSFAHRRIKGPSKDFQRDHSQPLLGESQIRCFTSCCGFQSQVCAGIPYGNGEERLLCQPVGDSRTHKNTPRKTKLCSMLSL